MYESIEQEIKALKSAILTGIILTLLIGWIATMVSCNTFEGIGKDVSDTAEFFKERHNHGWEQD